MRICFFFQERAIMPRPSATDSTIDTSHLSSSTNNTPVVINGHITTSDMATSVSSIFTSTTPPRLLQQRSLPSTLSDDVLLSSLSGQQQQQHNDSIDLNLSSSPNSSIPIHRSSLIQLNNNPASIKTITTPLSVNASSLLSPMHSLRSTSSTRPLMEDKCIQCIDDETYNNEDEEMATTDDDNEEEEEEEEQDDEEQITDENSTEKKPESETSMWKKNELKIIIRFSLKIDHPVKKRKSRARDDASNVDESWTVAADSLLRNVLSQYGFRFLDIKCQQTLSTKFDVIQANLVVKQTFFFF
jgi:hypothetical protein